MTSPFSDESKFSSEGQDSMPPCHGQKGGKFSFSVYNWAMDQNVKSENFWKNTDMYNLYKPDFFVPNNCLKRFNFLDIITW